MKIVFSVFAMPAICYTVDILLIHPGKGKLELAHHFRAQISYAYLLAASNYLIRKC